MEKTVLRFRIVPPLYELNRCVVQVPARVGLVALQFTITSSGRQWIEAGPGVTMPGDPFGTLHNTIVEVTFPARVALAPAVPRGVPEIQEAALSHLNAVIGHYRFAANAPEIRTIAPAQARSFAWQVFDATGNATGGGSFMGGAFMSPDGEDAGVAAGSPEIAQRIKDAVKLGPIPLWVTLYFDALAEFALSNHRSGLAHLYMSFEMLATLCCHRLGRTKVGAVATDAFLDPRREERPTVWGVIKQIRDWAANGPSKTQLKRQTNRVWRRRNDILHGREVIVSREEVDDTLEAFRGVTGWLESVLQEATKLMRASVNPR